MTDHRVFMHPEAAADLIQAYEQAATTIDDIAIAINPTATTAGRYTGVAVADTLQRLDEAVGWARWAAGDLATRLAVLEAAEGQRFGDGRIGGFALADRSPHRVRPTWPQLAAAIVAIEGEPLDTTTLAALLTDATFAGGTDPGGTSGLIAAIGPASTMALVLAVQSATTTPADGRHPAAATDWPATATSAVLLARMLADAIAGGAPPWVADILLGDHVSTHDLYAVTALLGTVALGPAAARSLFDAIVAKRPDRIPLGEMPRRPDFEDVHSGVATSLLAAALPLISRHPRMAAAAGLTPVVLHDLLIGPQPDVAVADFLTDWFDTSSPDPWTDFQVVMATVGDHGLPGPASAAAVAALTGRHLPHLLGDLLPWGPNRGGPRDPQAPAVKSFFAALAEQPEALAIVAAGLAMTAIVILAEQDRSHHLTDDAALSRGIVAIGHMYEFVLEGLDDPADQSFITDVQLSFVGQLPSLASHADSRVRLAVIVASLGVRAALGDFAGADQRSEDVVYYQGLVDVDPFTVDEIDAARHVLPDGFSVEEQPVRLGEVLAANAAIVAGRSHPPLPAALGNDAGLLDPTRAVNRADFTAGFRRWLAADPDLADHVAYVANLFDQQINLVWAR